MGRYVDLLRSLPKTKRDVSGRSTDKSPEVVAVSKQFGREYFDGDRKYGYGGYRYDGRWKSVAGDIVDNYALSDGAYVLDVGCAKGFLVHELYQNGMPEVGIWCEAFGIDVSRYAVVEQLHPDAVGRLHLGSADDLPFPDGSFDLVLSINTLHNLPRPRLIRALQEMRRVSRGSMFVQVDAYRTEAEREKFLNWVLTAEFHGYPEDWLAVFKEAQYDGDYCWTIV